jgi:hypothetical protein
MFFNKPTAARPRHPHIIASDPSKDPDRVVVVNLSTKPCLGDPIDKIDAKAHPSLSEESYVRSDFAELTTLAALKARVASGAISLTKPVASEALLGKVHRVLGSSRRPTRELKAVLEKQGLLKK